MAKVFEGCRKTIIIDHPVDVGSPSNKWSLSKFKAQLQIYFLKREGGITEYKSKKNCPFKKGDLLC